MPKLPMIDEQRQMLQALLADRFQLKYHREEREGIVYFLVKTNNKLKLEPAKDKDAYPWSNGTIGTNITMPQLAARLSGMLDRPVIDKTGLEGPYHFKFEYEDADRATAILISMQGLGLKLESGKGPVGAIVVEHAEKPSEN